MELSKQTKKPLRVVPLWRSKRFLASLLVGIIVALIIFFLVYNLMPLTLFNSRLFFPTVGAFIVLSLAILFLPKFIVRIRDNIQDFIGGVTARVIEDFMKERERRRVISESKKKKEKKENHKHQRKIILDTSAIIDGRFLQVAKLGFLKAEFIAPQCVLDELQEIADSKDDLRRVRGRRGLDILKELKKVKDCKLDTADFKGKYSDMEVDKRLVKICREIKAELLTVDYNLNKVSGISGVRVLNINDLVNAIKAPVVPGEMLKVRPVQKGKEAGQAVAYLDDGTMVVVEQGIAYLNKEVNVKISRLLQTPAGQMIFATPN